MRHQDAKSGRQAAIVKRRLQSSDYHINYEDDDNDEVSDGEDGNRTCPVELKDIRLQGRQAVPLSSTRWLKYLIRHKGSHPHSN